MAEYRSKYYALKASIIEQKITIKDALKIRMLNNLGPSFKTYLTVVNDRMRTKETLDDDETLFKAIEEEETRMKAEQKAFEKFASAKDQSKTQDKEKKEKKTEFKDWPKFKKCGCKHLANKASKHANEECDKCHEKGHIARFHDSYTARNKDSSSSSSTSNSDKDSKTRTVTRDTRVVANKASIANTPSKIIADSPVPIISQNTRRHIFHENCIWQTAILDVVPSDTTLRALRMEWTYAATYHEKNNLDLATFCARYVSFSLASF